MSYRAIQSIFEHLHHQKVQAVAKYRRQAGAHQAASARSAAPIASAKGSVKRNGSYSSLGGAGTAGGAGAGSVSNAVEVDEPEVLPAGSSSSSSDAIFRAQVDISMLEIYNEQVHDLLHEATGSGQASSDSAPLDIRQGADHLVSVPGLRQVTVNSMEDVLRVFHSAKSRATASTALNECSSRSHLVIQVDVAIDRRGSGDVQSASQTTGKMFLVDLAGSERIAKSGAVGNTMKEAVYINKSLLALGDVMEALDQKQKHVPYR